MSLRRLPARLHLPFPLLLLGLLPFACCPPVHAAVPIDSLTGYTLTEVAPAPVGESLVSYDWDAAGVLYYMTGDPNWGLKLNVYRLVSGVETPVYQSAALFPGSRLTAVGSFLYFNDGGDYARYTFNYYAYNPATGGQPALSYDSAVAPLSLWGIDTRDGTQFFASGAVGFGPSSIYYMPAPEDGQLDGLVSIGDIGESSGPIAFDRLGNLYYAHGYVYSGQAKIFRWSAAELAGAIANPALSPLSPADHEWATLPAAFTGASGLAVDDAGNVYVTANAWGVPGELLLYRPNPTIPLSVAQYTGRLETLRIREGKLHVNCAAGIYQMPLALSVSLAGPDQVDAVSGRPITLSVETTGGNGPLTYQWFLAGSGKADMSLGNNAPSLTFVPEKGDSGNQYYCTVNDSGLTVTSPRFTLQIVATTPAVSRSGMALVAVLFALSAALARRQSAR